MFNDASHFCKGNLAHYKCSPVIKFFIPFSLISVLKCSRDFSCLYYKRLHSSISYLRLPQMFAISKNRLKIIVLINSEAHIKINLFKVSHQSANTIHSAASVARYYAVFH